MKITEKLIALFFTLLAAATVFQGQAATMAEHNFVHHKTLNSHTSIGDTAETPDEHREESFARKHHFKH